MAHIGSGIRRRWPIFPSSVLLALVPCALAVGVARTDWDPNDPCKWVQLPDETPNGMDVRAEFPRILADDFPCEETGPLVRIHVWGSWFGDRLPDNDPTAVIFTLSIHKDIPAEENPDGYSIPGMPLWVRQFQAR